MFRKIILETCLENNINKLSEVLKKDTNVGINCKKEIVRQTVDPLTSNILIFYKMFLAYSDKEQTLEKLENYSLKILITFPLSIFSVDETEVIKDIIFEYIKKGFDNNTFHVSNDIFQEFKDKFPNLFAIENLNYDNNLKINSEVGDGFIDTYSQSKAVISYEGTLNFSITNMIL